MEVNIQAIKDDKHLCEVAAKLVAYSFKDIDGYSELTKEERSIVSAEDFEKMTSV